MTTKEKSKDIEAEGILVAEYEYIAQTAFQANEDRARVTSFYIVSIGSLFGAFFGTTFQTDTETLTYAAFASLFLFLSWFGVLTLKQLIRLRKAWFESAKAMNQIKDFIIEENEKFSKALRWQSSTLPKMYKPSSVAYLLAQQVIILGAITFGAMFFYAAKVIENLCSITFFPAFLAILSLAGGFFFWKYQINLYRKELRQKK
ncbi:MAG: hypothetical protein GY755_20910 [Chloroflexi bacterium]|nr:hypothetical protein [Chloroflexota bacterium]